MVILPIDVYKNLVNADGQQHHRIETPLLASNEKLSIRRQPQQQILRKILKGVNKKQVSKIVKKNGKPKRKNKLYFNPEFPASLSSLHKFYTEAKKVIKTLKRSDLKRWAQQSYIKAPTRHLLMNVY